MLGKKIYKTSLLNILRLILMILLLVFFYFFYVDTFSDPRFIEANVLNYQGVIKYHFRYPEEFILFFFLTLGPLVYYSFIRGTKFYEKGLVLNRGVPFLNKTVMYSEIIEYKMLHPQNALSLKLENEDIVLVVDNDISRVVSILDIHGITGNLVQNEYVKLLNNLKSFMFILFLVLFVLLIIKKYGVFQLSI